MDVRRTKEMKPIIFEMEQEYRFKKTVRAAEEFFLSGSFPTHPHLGCRRESRGYQPVACIHVL